MEDLSLRDPQNPNEMITRLVAAILTPAIIERRARSEESVGRELTPEEILPIRRAVVNEWIRTCKYLGGLHVVGEAGQSSGTPDQPRQ